MKRGNDPTGSCLSLSLSGGGTFLRRYTTVLARRALLLLSSGEHMSAPDAEPEKGVGVLSLLPTERETASTTAVSRSAENRCLSGSLSRGLCRALWERAWLPSILAVLSLSVVEDNWIGESFQVFLFLYANRKKTELPFSPLNVAIAPRQTSVECSAVSNTRAA